MTKRDNLTSEKEMSFLDHLEELRWHLIRSTLAIVVLATIAFLAKEFIFDVLIFLVGLAHSKGKKNDIDKFREINYQTLYNLLSSLSKNNKTPKKER